MRTAVVCLAVAQSAAALPQWGPPSGWSMPSSWSDFFSISSWGYPADQGPSFGVPGQPYTPLPLISHVVAISVDGMHASDIPKYLAARPNSNFQYLLNTGYLYPNAFTSAPSDSFPGTVAQYTGATVNILRLLFHATKLTTHQPSYSGVWYDDTWDYTMYPAGTNCTGPIGTEVLYDETIDYNDTLLFSGGIDPTKLPMAVLNGKCTPVYPHMYLRANSLFEVVRSKVC